MVNVDVQSKNVLIRSSQGVLSWRPPQTTWQNVLNSKSRLITAKLNAYFGNKNTGHIDEIMVYAGRTEFWQPLFAIVKQFFCAAMEINYVFTNSSEFWNGSALLSCKILEYCTKKSEQEFNL